jgi:AmmeMemoRadiSam system protein B
MMKHGIILLFITIALLSFWLLAPKRARAAEEIKKIRRSVLAGSWYPGSKASLEEAIRGYWQSVALPREYKNVVALISPHAGYRYSGPVAAYGYKAIQKAPIKRVIVLAPSHRVYLRGVAIADYTHYETPLGLIPLDLPTCTALRKEKIVSSSPDADRQEHSLEIQLPFLQMALTDFQLVPIMVGEMNEAEFTDFARILRPYLDQNSLIVASSDFTHYGQNFGYYPFREDIENNLRKLDMEGVSLIEKLDFSGFRKFIGRTGATICGNNPIGLLLKILDGRTDVKAELLKYDTSGRMLQDFSSSVSYVSAVFVKK